jgi:blue copper oxidase
MFSWSGDSAANLNSQDPEGFSNPLRLPGQDGILGLFEPQSPFTIQAASAATTILPEKQTSFLAYGVNTDGKSFFNPILKIRKGARVTARLRNGLAQNTIVHWHGLILDQANDGIPLEAIAPAATYQYDYMVRNRASTYWYHPHPMPGTAEQVYRGLASFFLVEDEDELRLRKALDLQLGKTDIPILIQDKRFDDMGNVMYNPSVGERFMGIMGDTILVNLTVKPFLEVTPRIYRFRLLNGSNARIYRFAFMQGSNKQGFHIIGVDGGFLAQPAPASELFLAPGERADILLDLSDSAEGDELYLKSLAFDPMDNEGMSGSTGMQSATSMGMGNTGLADGAEFYILKLQVGSGPRGQRSIPSMLSTITPINLSSATVRPVTLSTNPMAMQWYINEDQYDPTQAPIEVPRNSVEIWEIVNEMQSMPHPMHIHGFQFQVLERVNSPAQVATLAGANGLLPTDTGWKDTILVWPGETVRIVLDFRHPFQGDQEYVFHCHNLEHEERGMMVNYKVIS